MPGRPPSRALTLVLALYVAGFVGALVLTYLFSGLGGPLHGAGRRGPDLSVTLSTAIFFGFLPALLVSAMHVRGPTFGAQAWALGVATLIPVVHPVASFGVAFAVEVILGRSVADVLRQPHVAWFVLATEILAVVVVSSGAWLRDKEEKS